MVPESQYCEMQARMPEIKSLYTSRRYVQCANICERMLDHSYDEIHPIHRAYLHFYFALVHDTMARETTVRYRSSSLDLAIKHYLAAIEILTPSEPYNLDDLLSPWSEPEEEQLPRFRSTTKTPSYRTAPPVAAKGNAVQDRIKRFEQISSSNSSPTRSPPRVKPEKRRPAPIAPINAARAYQQEQFSGNLCAFLGMVQVHLCSAQQLKDSMLTSRDSFTCFSRSSNRSSRPSSRASSTSSVGDLDQPRWERRTLSFRPRFDPSSTQQLCNEVLSEL